MRCTCYRILRRQGISNLNVKPVKTVAEVSLPKQVALLKEIKARELEIASARTQAATAEMKQKAAAQKPSEEQKTEEVKPEIPNGKVSKVTAKASKSKKAEEKPEDDMFDFDEEDEDLF